MPRSQRETESALGRKGFVRSESHHTYFVYHDTQGRKSPIRTRTSHGCRELDDYLLAQMAKQCQITKQQFLNLIDCQLNQAGYQDLLIQNGRL
jgi:hypothetical protein